MTISTLLMDKRIKVSLIVIVGAMIAYLGFLTWLNRVHRIQNDIDQFWSLLGRVCEERVALLPQFATVIQSRAPQANALVQAIDGVYKQVKPFKFPDATLNNPNALQNMTIVQQSVVGVLSQIQSKVPPEVIQDKQYQALMLALEERELQIQFAVHALTKQVVFYNRLTYDLPQRWVNKMLTHFPPKYFPDVPTLTGIRHPAR